MLPELFMILNECDHLFLSNAVSSIDHGILGLTLIFYPTSLLWKHNDTLSQQNSLDNHEQGEQGEFEEVFTDFSKIFLMGTGTALLTVLLYHVFFLEDQRDERVLLRLKLVNYICQFLLLVESHEVLGTQKLPFASNLFLTARMVIAACMTVWLTLTLMRSTYNRVSADFKSVEMAVMLELAYYLSIAYIVVMMFSSSSSRESSVNNNENSWFFLLQSTIFAATCWQGVHLVAFLVVLLLNVECVPTADAKILQIHNLLFLLVLLAATVHPAGERWAVQLFLVAHALVTFLVWKLSGSKDSSLTKELSASRTDSVVVVEQEPPEMIPEKVKVD
jgi:hypothetical protein